RLRMGGHGRRQFAPLGNSFHAWALRKADHLPGVLSRGSNSGFASLIHEFATPAPPVRPYSFADWLHHITSAAENRAPRGSTPVYGGLVRYREYPVLRREGLRRVNRKLRPATGRRDCE